MDITDSRVLVVGGAGLVGSHLVDQLIHEPVREIIVFDNFVRGTRASQALVTKALSGWLPDDATTPRLLVLSGMQ
jgi:nucleoside-diphosphate-sugar epimerase